MAADDRVLNIGWMVTHSTKCDGLVQWADDKYGVMSFYVQTQNMQQS